MASNSADWTFDGALLISSARMMRGRLASARVLLAELEKVGGDAGQVEFVAHGAGLAGGAVGVEPVQSGQEPFGGGVEVTEACGQDYR